MIWICLLVQFAFAADRSGPKTVLSEAQICAASLCEAHRDEQRQILQSVLWHDQQVERALARRREAGLLTEVGSEGQLRARLVLESALAMDDLLTEAVYQVFKDRYRGKDAIRAALRNFRHLSESKDQVELVGEVTERVLQYIRDVDSHNLAKVEATAQFVGMNGDQLARFRAIWMLYDNEDQFTPLLYDAIRDTLSSVSEDFVERVHARAGLVRGFVRQWRTVAVPGRPRVNVPPPTPRQIQASDKPYFDDVGLINYLAESSSAARRFFLSQHLKSLTDAQLKMVLFRKDVWWLKDSLLAALEDERQARVEIKSLYSEYDRFNREYKALHAVHDRRASARPYDARALERSLSQLRGLSKGADVLRLAQDFFEQAAATCDSKQYVGALVSLFEAVGTKLSGQENASLDLILAAIKGANKVGIEQGAPLTKAKEILDRLARHAGPRAPLLAGPLIDRLDFVPATISRASTERLSARLAESRAQLQRASDALDEFERARN